MKHLFVINPYAGKEDATPVIKQKINMLDDKPDYDIYVTQAPGDATRFVVQWCQEHPQQSVRFYACGGDGTINEVTSGILQVQNGNAVSDSHIQMTCYACGSGNDYIKYYPGDYTDLHKLINGTPHRVDVMQVNDRYSINVCNFGFDALVCKTMIEVKRKPIIGGSHAYTTGIVKGLFKGRKSLCRITADGQPFHDGHMLLCTISNGRYVGGAYQCAPRSLNDDGLVEVLLFKPVALASFLSMISAYKNGKQFELPHFQKHMKYTRAKTLDLDADTPFDLCIDGEMLVGSHFHIQNLQQVLTFVAPTK